MAMQSALASSKQILKSAGLSVAKVGSGILQYGPSFAMSTPYYAICAPYPGKKSFPSSIVDAAHLLRSSVVVTLQTRQ